MSSARSSDPASVLERLQRAMNAHDLDAFVSCFHADYRSEQPAHPDRTFAGAEQVRKNWSALFAGIPDFRTERVRSVVDGDVLWVEWSWEGTRVDGSPARMRGVTLFGVEEDRIAWGRLYMEPVEQAGAGIDPAVARMAGTEPPQR